MEWFRRPDGSIAVSEVAARPPGAQITSMLGYVHEVDFYRVWAELVIHGTFSPPERRYAAGTATAGTTPQTVARNRTMSVRRGDLADDFRLIGGELRSLGDQIRCRIDITPVGLPAPVSELTDQENLRPVTDV